MNIVRQTTQESRLAQDAALSSSPALPSFLDELDEDLKRRERGGFMSAVPGAARYPTLDVVRDRDRMMVHAELPGMTWKDIRINLTSDGLILEGERRPQADEGQELVRREGSFGKFYRWLPLDTEVVPSQMKVQMCDGILRLEVPIAASEAA